MRSKNRIGLHKTAIASLYTLGSAILRFPWRDAGDAVPVWLGIYLLTAFLTAVPGSVLLHRLFHRPLCGNRFRLAVAATVVCLLLSAAFYTAWRTASGYSAYAEETLVDPANRALFLFLFLLTAGLLARIPRRGTDLLALVAFALSLLSFVWLFLRATPQFGADRIAFSFPDDRAAWGTALTSVAPDAVVTFLPLAAYFGCALPGKEPRRNASVLTAGIATGGGILLLRFLQTVLTFGIAFASTRNNPYFSAISVIRVGQYAFRPEILSYLPDFAACTVRVSLCLACIRRLTGRFLPHIGRGFVLPAAAAVWILLLSS